MGDTYRKPFPGDPLLIPASLMGTLIDVAESFKRGKLSGGAGANIPGQREPDLILVKNNSGIDLTDSFGVLGLDDPLFLPSDTNGLRSFRQSVAFNGVTPTAGAHRGRFAVVLQPLADGKMGPGIVSGAQPCQINVVAEAHPFADVMDGDQTQLQSDWGGTARILWKEAGTGQKWAVLLLGSGNIGSGQYQGMNYTTVTQNVGGFDFQRAYALPGV